MMKRGDYMTQKRDILGEVKSAWANMKDPNVETWKKATAVAVAGAYILSPVDIIPDMIPVVGQIDDIAVSYFILKGFNKLAEHKTAPQVEADKSTTNIFDKFEKYTSTTDTRHTSIERER